MEANQERDALASLRREVAQLADRVAALEASPRGQGEASPVAAASPALDEEVLLAISAAVAAFLGVQPHIRHIRLLRSASWAQQGRATIQASHQLEVHHR